MRFLRAYIEGIHYFRTNREGSIRALQKFFRGATAEQIAFLYDNQREVFDAIAASHRRGDSGRAGP